jgi:AAA ATPase domain
MKLKEFRVREFRSIWDSGRVELDDQVTCLVGKNEAGKTALLTALYRTNPIIPEDAAFDETYDYPKREVEDCRFAVEKGERGEVLVVECLYELDDDDISSVTSVFGPDVLEGKTFGHKTYYGKAKIKFSLLVDEAAARRHLADNPRCRTNLRSRSGAPPTGTPSRPRLMRRKLPRQSMRSREPWQRCAPTAFLTISSIP